MRATRTLLVIFLITLSALAESQLPAPPPPPPPPPPSGSGIVYKADSLMNEGNIKEAVAEYRKMLESGLGDSGIIYNFACALSRDNQPDSSFKYLYIFISTDPTTRPMTDPDLLTIRQDKRWEDFENKLVQKITKKSGNSIKNIKYAKALWRIQCMDQDCFYETGIAVKKLGPDSPVVAALRRLQSIINEKNLTELEFLLNENGWPQRSEVGVEAGGAAFFVIQHSNAQLQQKYISMFEKCCRENEASWMQYALMFDRMRMNQNLPQRYGTHYNLDNRATNKRILYPLEDETKVDEWRKEIGLETLKDYLERSNIQK